MGRRACLLVIVVLLALGLSPASAGPYLEDAQGDAHQTADRSLDPQPTKIDIRRARFIEKRKTFKFKVETYELVDMVVFCSDVDCGDYANKGFIDIDFYTLKKDGDSKRYYFIELRAADGGMDATLREFTDKGSEIVKVLQVGTAPPAYSVTVPRKLLKSMDQGVKMRWNARGVYWWDPVEPGDFCNFEKTANFQNACVDFVPNRRDAKVKLKK